MSIKDKAEEARQNQQERIAERRSKEAQARPQTIHRAVVYLLRQMAINNRDTRQEANYLITALDNELADAQKVAEIETPPPAVNTSAAGDAPDPPNVAKLLKASKRFKRT
jgi:hypothetical protein